MKVAIIGGGPAGCAAAYTLQKAGVDFELFEAAEKVGGRTKQLHRDDGYNLGTGALFLMGASTLAPWPCYRRWGEKNNWCPGPVHRNLWMTIIPDIRFGWIPFSAS